MDSRFRGNDGKYLIAEYHCAGSRRGSKGRGPGFFAGFEFLEFDGLVVSYGVKPTVFRAVPSSLACREAAGRLGKMVGWTPCKTGRHDPLGGCETARNAKVPDPSTLRSDPGLRQFAAEQDTAQIVQHMIANRHAGESRFRSCRGRRYKSIIFLTKFRQPLYHPAPIGVWERAWF